MQRSRTIKTLACLVVAMTTGTFVLLALETKPAGTGYISPLTAMRTPANTFGQQVNNTAIPIRPEKWLNIVIHDSACSDIGNFSTDCHFIVYGELSADSGLNGACRSTEAWQAQTAGNHVYVPGCDFNSHSISICVEGDLVANKPSDKQAETLFGLLRSLQRKFSIPADKVYLHSELTGQYCPGDSLSRENLQAQLLLTND